MNSTAAKMAFDKDASMTVNDKTRKYQTKAKFWWCNYYIIGMEVTFKPVQLEVSIRANSGIFLNGMYWSSSTKIQNDNPHM